MWEYKNRVLPSKILILKKISLTLLLAMLVIAGCNKDNRTKTFNPDKRIVSFKERIKDIPFSEIVQVGGIEITDSIIIVEDYSGFNDRVFYLLNKNDFQPITKSLKLGKGPGEITRAGFFTTDILKRKLYLNDHGKNVVWEIPLGSMISNPEYLPSQNLRRNPLLLLQEYYPLDDSLMLGIAMHPLSPGTFEIKTVKWDVRKNTIIEFGYEHPEAQGIYLSTMSFGVSLKDSCYFKAHYWLDLLTICNLDGTLKFNIYGPDWGKNNKLGSNIYFFGGVKPYHDLVLAAYVGDKATITDENKREKGNSPSKILVFTQEGDYIATIDLGINFTKFAVDEENNRIILSSGATDEPLKYFILDPQEIQNLKII